MSTIAIAAQIGPCSPAVPGQGFLTIQGWGGTAATLEFALMENQNRHFLQGDGNWGNAPYWFSSSFVQAEGGDGLRCHVGEEIVGALLRCNSNVMHRLQLRDPADHGRMGQQALRIVPGLQLPTAGHTPQAGGGGGLTSPLVVDPPPEPKSEPKSEPMPEPQSGEEGAKTITSELGHSAVQEPAAPFTPKSKSWLQRFGWLLLLIALLLVAGGAAVWWFLFKAKLDAAEPEVPAPAAVSAPAAAAPCSAEAMQADGEMAFVQNCIAQSPASEALLQTIAAAKQNKHCGIAQRLYANRSQAGDLLIAEAYAKEYDPKFHQASDCFQQPEADTAVYWWDTILSFDAQNELAQERMKELKP